jgi:hypothetical protein
VIKETLILCADRGASATASGVVERARLDYVGSTGIRALALAVR